MARPEGTQPQDTTPRSSRERGYPPQLGYEWQSFGSLDEKDQKSIKDLVDQQRPGGYKPKDILYHTGQRDDRVTLELVFEMAKVNSKAVRGFPFLENRWVPGVKALQEPVIEYAQLEDVNPSTGSVVSQYFVLLQHPRAHDELYIDARAKYLKEVNEILPKINRNQIPPPPNSVKS